MATDTSNAGAIVTILGAVIAAVIAVFSFLMKYIVDRISGAKEVASKAQGIAEIALQEAAEAKQENHETRELLDQVIRDMHEEIQRIGREVGESNAAIRQHITELAFFARDNFARKDDLAAAVMKIEAGQIRTDAKIETGQANIDKKIDDLRDLIRNGDR